MLESNIMEDSETKLQEYPERLEGNDKGKLNCGVDH